MEIAPVTSNRANRFMLEGVGTRVIRGPDWKWGKQVSNCEILGNLFLLKRRRNSKGAAQDLQL